MHNGDQVLQPDVTSVESHQPGQLPKYFPRRRLVLGVDRQRANFTDLIALSTQCRDRFGIRRFHRDAIPLSVADEADAANDGVSANSDEYLGLVPQMVGHDPHRRLVGQRQPRIQIFSLQQLKGSDIIGAESGRTVSDRLQLRDGIL